MHVCHGYADHFAVGGSTSEFTCIYSFDPEGGPGADPEGGRTPTLFRAEFYKKSPKLAKKILWASPWTPCAPSFLKSWISPCGEWAFKF